MSQLEKVLADPKNEEYIDTFNFLKIYDQLNPIHRTEFTELLLAEGYDPIAYMKVIPMYCCSASLFESIRIYSNVEKILSYAFYNSLMTRITFEEGVTRILDGAFCRCTEVKSIYLPDSLIELGHEAFRYCTKLEELRVGPNIRFIGTKAFTDLPNLKEIKFDMPLDTFIDKVRSNSFSQHMFDDDKHLIIKCLDGDIDWDA